MSGGTPSRGAARAAPATSAFDAVLVIAFGGPESLDEVRPFLRRVLAGRPIPEARFEAVAHHYEVIGGRSPGPEISRRQTRALETALRARGLALPVVLGMRNSAPFLTDALSEIAARGGRRALGLILAAHESEASHGRYRGSVAAAQKELGERAPEVAYSGSFHTHPGFVAANAEHLARALAALPDPNAAKLVFTAHSIPTPMQHPYVAQLEQSARLVAAAVHAAGHAAGHQDDYRIAYQSRSGAPSDPWLEPDINAVIREEAAAGTRTLALCPLGFVCDHVEVLYDLDIEAAQTAQEVGVQLVRAAAANDHPAFIEALADTTCEALER
jgi:ferrochelatase